MSQSDHSKPQPHVIVFTLDGEEKSTTERDWTPNRILAKFGEKDPAAYYLVQILGNHKVSFKDKGEEPLHLEDHNRFISVSLGATPVSDLNRTGVAAFVDGLIALGYQPEVVDHQNRRVKFTYVVELGPHAGREVIHGIEVPADFPLTPPAGPHVSPQIHGGVAVGDAHPKGGIHASPFGPDFEYWSRPFPNWNGQPVKSVGTYLAHLRRLWELQ